MSNNNCMACDGYGFLKNMSICLLCFGSGKKEEDYMDVTSSYKNLKDRVCDLLDELSLKDVIENMLIEKPITIKDEDMDYEAVIRSLAYSRDEVRKTKVVDIGIDVLIRLDPELKLTSFLFKRVVVDEELARILR